LAAVTTTLAVITGTSRGIGAGIAAAATGSGATVAACNRTPTEAEHQLTADLSDPASWVAFASWFDELVAGQEPDRVVVVHNSASLTPIGPAGSVDPAAYQRHVLLNSAAPQVIGDAVIRTARRHRKPTVLLQLSSGAAGNPFPGWSGYCAAKAAVEMWVRTVASETTGSDDGTPDQLIKVAAVRPGIVATDMQAEIRSSEPSAFPNVERFRALHADGALADPATVGATIWSLGQRAEWDTGAVLDVTQLG
jgi:NAD(P)-dependent dehydrogenase (short-subunit alcohol dehydrogenase family)